jgi:copper chaperone CopZ
MTCASCTQSISSTLKVQPDILEVTVNLLSASALVRHRPSLPAATIAELVEDTGFECSVVSSAVDRPPTCPKDRAGTTEVLMRTTFMIEDMTCGSSSSTTEATISTYRGVKSVTIDISGNTAAVVHDTDVSPAGLREAVKQAGYGAKVTKSEKVSPCSEACHFEPDKHRTINIAVRGIFCPNCVDKINTHLATMDLISYSPISMTRQSTTIAYAPRRPYVIRDILQSLSDLAPEFQSEVVKTKTLSDRSQEIQHKEFVKLASHLTVAVLFAIPTFTMRVPIDGRFQVELIATVVSSAWCCCLDTTPFV